MSSSPVLGATVNADLIMVSVDDFVALDAPLSNEIAVSTVNEPLMRLSHYRYEEVCINVVWIANPTFSLRNVQRCHVKDLLLSIRAPSYYRDGMITATWSTICNPRNSSVDGANEERDGQKKVSS